jgi:hypothetical protein
VVPLQFILCVLCKFISELPLLARGSTLSMEIKLHLYKTVIRPTMTYANPVWCTISNSTYRNLQVVQNKCLRVITNSPRSTPMPQLHRITGIEYIQPHILRLAERFYSTCASHTNPLIRSIGRYTLQDLHKLYKHYKHKRPKHALL